MEIKPVSKSSSLICRIWASMYLPLPFFFFLAILTVLGNKPQILDHTNHQQKFFFAILLFWPVAALLFYKKLRLALVLDSIRQVLWNRKNFRAGKWFLISGVLLYLLLKALTVFVFHYIPAIFWVLALMIGQVCLFSVLSSRFILGSERKGNQIRVVRMLAQVMCVCGKGTLILMGVQLVLLYLGLWPQLTAISLPEILKSLQQLGWIHHILRGVLFLYGGIFAAVNFLYELFSWILIQILLPGLAFWKVVDEDSKTEISKN